MKIIWILIFNISNLWVFEASKSGTQASRGGGGGYKNAAFSRPAELAELSMTAAILKKLSMSAFLQISRQKTSYF